MPGLRLRSIHKEQQEVHWGKKPARFATGFGGSSKDIQISHM